LHELGALSADERAEKMPTLSDTRFTPEWLASHPTDAQMMSMRSESTTKSADVIRGERLQLAARIGHDVADRLHVIPCPTFVTAGKFDGIASPVNSEAIVERISDATLSLYEGGHMFIAQDPTAIREIRTFLSTGVRPSGR
jgi:pimeloyl-ACP methyl ester carboxylesterase